ncbi:MAG: TlpA disulfide reductase family protein [Flavobacteriales bacterium]
MKARFLIIAVTMFLFGCKSEQDNSAVIGMWRVSMDLGGTSLPFHAEIMDDNGKLQCYAINGDERIRADEFLVRGDSFFIRLPIFNTELIGLQEGDKISGFYHDYSRKGDYKMPFVGYKTDKTRFNVSSEPTINVAGKWKVEFSPGSDNEYQAIGLFEQDGNKAYGTFLTTTGDYRFLEGNVSGDSLFLSCFDGSHAFLFKAKVDGDKIMGDFWSGSHWQENWTGTRDELYELPDPTSLTFLNPGYKEVDFSFKNMSGEFVSPKDERYADKVIVVQIMGSWCPNCKDETAYLVSLYNKFNGQGLEVISLAFEKSDNEETNLRSLQRLKEHFGIPYEILLAGTASKTEAAKKLPMLNHVLSFPTTIFMDRTGEVRRIHTGFAGPGTGEYYSEFVEETDRFVTQLLIE